jgi:low temperature requirement protein LtrA
VTSDAQPEQRPLRERSVGRQVTNMELFADLVYIFAIIQLSSHLRSDPTVSGVLQSTLLLTMFWLIWIYVTWVTNYMDPGYIEIRLLLIAGMLVSLAMAAALPRAFGDLGLVVGGGYALLQSGRSLFVVLVLRGPLRKNFERILAWCLVVGAFALAGGLVHGPLRAVLWVLAVATDVTGGLAGFATPGLGRSSTRDWAIDGAHFAARCQAFVLIALGESVIVTGETLSGLHSVTGLSVAGFAVAFAGSVTLWWLYFAHSASASASVIASSRDPGRLARSAYQLVHPVMVAGVIVWSAGDEKILTSPLSSVNTESAWKILGGPALFLVGHAVFNFVVWRRIPWTRVIGAVVVASLALAADALPRIALAACVAAVVAAVVVGDHFSRARFSPRTQ